MDRVVLVSKETYAALLESLQPLERILIEVPTSYLDGLDSKGNGRMALQLISMTPEGPRYLWFLSIL